MCLLKKSVSRSVLRVNKKKKMLCHWLNKHNLTTTDFLFIVVLSMRISPKVSIHITHIS